MISFVSEAWGGRTSDKFLTENFGFLRNLLPKDLVLADRGFTIHDKVMFYHENLNIPTFTKGKSQLDPVKIGYKTTVIIDSFEIFINMPTNLMARAQTFSSYKHHNTVKVLIGISPQGMISFVSEAWGGRTSDKFLTENFGFLRNLLPKDLVLADRGFTIHDKVMFYHENLNIPTFTKGKSQLDPVKIGYKTTVIIDSFEIFINMPTNLMARAQTFSSYKHHNTVKVLIGISPQGMISFVSEAWGGRTSDKFLTENFGFLRNLLPKDLVLADRGFTIHDKVMFYHENLNIPTFTKGKSQLDPVKIEKNTESC